MRSLLHILPELSLLAFLLVGCGGEAPPAAEVIVEHTELELPHGAFVPLDLYWKLRRPLPAGEGELFVFVHLLEEPGGVVRTFDYLWPGGWQAGGAVRHRVYLHQSSLGPPLEPGTYSLSLGVYGLGGRRWPLVVRGEPVDRHEYHVANVVIPAGEGGGMVYQFSPEWMDIEQGRDRQVLARRWLTGSGQLQVVGVEGNGELWLRLLLPSPGDRQELVLTEGASQQGALVRSDCGGVEVRLGGVGHHDVVLPLTAPAAGDTCTVSFEPDFYLFELETGDRRTLSLDGLGWASRSSSEG